MADRAAAVYIMTSVNNTVLYTGCTPDLVRRSYEHRTRMAPGSFTAKYHVEKPVYYEIVGEVYEALQRETQIKGWTRQKKNALIRASNPTWDDLWPTLHR